MTFGQIMLFLQACHATARYELLKMNGYVNMYSISRKFVCPWSENTGNSIALLMNQTGLKAKLMVSHAWGEDNEELIEAITSYCKAKSLPADIAIWLCTFALYQAEDGVGPTIEEQLQQDPFNKVIQSRPQVMVAIHTSTANLYERLWCPFEMHKAIAYEIEVHAAPSRAYVEQLKSSYAYFERFAGGDKKDALEMFILKNLKVNTAAAQCSSEADTKNIRKAIEIDGGFELLDKAIFVLRKQFVQKILDLHPEQRPADLGADVDEPSSSPSAL